MWNLNEWGNLERFYSFAYKLTSVNGQVGNGEVKRIRNHFVHINNLYIWGFYAYFHLKMLLGMFVSLYEIFIRNIRMIKFNS